MPDILCHPQALLYCVQSQALLHCVAIIKFSGESGLRNCLLGLINGIWWNHFWHHTLTNRLLAEPSWPLTFPSWVISLLFYPVRRDFMVSAVCSVFQWPVIWIQVTWSPLLSPPFVLGNKAYEYMHTLVRSCVFPPPFTLSFLPPCTLPLLPRWGDLWSPHWGLPWCLLTGAAWEDECRVHATVLPEWCTHST